MTDEFNNSYKNIYLTELELNPLRPENFLKISKNLMKKKQIC